MEMSKPFIFETLIPHIWRPVTFRYDKALCQGGLPGAAACHKASKFSLLGCSWKSQNCLKTGLLTYFMIILVHEPSQTLVTGMLDIWKPRDARSDGDVMSPAIQAYKDIIKTSSLIGRNT